MKPIMLTANANMGFGLWTAICFMFANLMGVESKNYLKKHNNVLRIAKERLTDEFLKLGPGYSLIDFRVTWTSPLTVTISGLAVKAEIGGDQPTTCPKCGEPIDAEMIFCGNCGQKLK